MFSESVPALFSYHVDLWKSGDHVWQQKLLLLHQLTGPPSHLSTSSFDPVLTVSKVVLTLGAFLTPFPKRLLLLPPMLTDLTAEPAGCWTLTQKA